MCNTKKQEEKNLFLFLLLKTDPNTFAQHHHKCGGFFPPRNIIPTFLCQIQ